MRFGDVEVENFLAIGKAKLNLDGRGLHLIQGANNEDSSASSNGAGKSSLVDALSWGLYGVTARDASGDEVVNRAAKKNTAVILNVHVGATHYRIERYRKHKEHKNGLYLWAIQPVGVPAVDLSKGTVAETQKEIEKIVGSKDVFLAAVYCGQEAMPDLPRMADRELKSLIEQSAGMTRVERAYTVARDRANDVKASLASVSMSRTNAGMSLDSTEADLKNARTAEADWESARAGRVSAAQTDADAAGNALRDAVNECLNNKPGADAARTQIGGIDTQLADHRRLQSEANAATQAHSAAELKVERHALKQAVDAITAINNQIANAAAEVHKPCVSCGTPATGDVEAYVKHRQAHLVTATAALEAKKTQVRAQLATVATLKTAADAARAAVPDVSALQNDKADLQRIVDTYTRMESRVQGAKANHTAAKTALATRQGEVNPRTNTVEVLEKRLATEVAKVAALQSQLEKLTADAAIADSVVKVFGPAGVRAQILDTVTPFLNARTSDYLSVMSDGNITAIWTTLTKTASGDLREKFGIEVSHAKGGDSFKLISGGEKRKVRLACALALQDLVASRAVQPIELFIGDEIDDAMDVAGIERLMTILERRGRERGTVVVISHNEMRDWIDDVTVVTKKAEFISEVEGSLCV